MKICLSFQHTLITRSMAEKNIIKVANQLPVPENLHQGNYWKRNSILKNNAKIKEVSREIKKNPLDGIKMSQ